MMRFVCIKKKKKGHCFAFGGSAEVYLFKKVREPLRLNKRALFFILFESSNRQSIAQEE